MVKVLEDLWIVTKTGIVLFHPFFNQKVEANLFGAMVNGFNLFAENLSEGGLMSYGFVKKRFTLILKNNLLFVADSSINLD